jgi:hypothetical protein
MLLSSALALLQLESGGTSSTGDGGGGGSSGSGGGGGSGRGGGGGSGGSGGSAVSKAANGPGPTRAGDGTQRLVCALLLYPGVLAPILSRCGVKQEDVGVGSAAAGTVGATVPARHCKWAVLLGHTLFATAYAVRM